MASTSRAISSLLCRRTAAKTSAGLTSSVRTVSASTPSSLRAPATSIPPSGRVPSCGIAITAASSRSRPSRSRMPSACRVRRSRRPDLRPATSTCLPGTTWRTSLIRCSASRVAGRVAERRVDHPQQHFGRAHRDVVARGRDRAVGLGRDEVVVARDGEPGARERQPVGDPAEVGARGDEGRQEVRRDPERVEHRGPGCAGVLVEQPGAGGEGQLGGGAAAERRHDELGQVEPAQAVELQALVAEVRELGDGGLRSEREARCGPANSARTSAGKAATCAAPRGSNHANAGATGFASSSTSTPVSPIPAIARAVTGASVSAASLPGCGAEQSLDGGDQLVGEQVRGAAGARAPRRRHLLDDQLRAVLGRRRGASCRCCRGPSPPRACPSSPLPSP